MSRFGRLSDDELREAKACELLVCLSARPQKARLSSSSVSYVGPCGHWMQAQAKQAGKAGQAHVSMLEWIKGGDDTACS